MIQKLSIPPNTGERLVEIIKKLNEITDAVNLILESHPFAEMRLKNRQIQSQSPYDAGVKR